MDPLGQQVGAGTVWPFVGMAQNIPAAELFKNIIKMMFFYQSKWLKSQTEVGNVHTHLVGGSNPCEKYESKWESSPSRGENKKKHETTS